MIGLMQIMIYLFGIYLVYKGVEIFQVAFVSNNPNKLTKTVGIVIGVLSIVAAVLIGAGAIVMTESIVAHIGDNMPKLR